MMEWASMVISNLLGKRSGNQSSKGVFGSHTTITNMYVQREVTNFAVGKQRMLGGQDCEASRPYRLLPYGRNSTFTGRENLIECVRAFCQPNAHNRVALYGLGGSGKTQIALEYVYRCSSERDCSVFWVQGSGLSKFCEGFRALAQNVGIPLPSPEIEAEGFLQSIKTWFEGPKSGNWILVIDNADNDADFFGNNSPIAKFIPQGTKGTIIFTTRSRQVALSQGCKFIEVAKMSDGEANELFSKRFGSLHNLEDKDKCAIPMILASVSHLPLAIVGSAAFMAATETPPSVYWALFQESDEQRKKLLSQQFCDIQREVDSTESILDTYFITFDQIAQEVPLAGDILRLISFFDRQNIPEELLSQCALEGTGDPVAFRTAIGRLLGSSLVKMVKHEGKRFYELHHLVQLSLQVYLSSKELDECKAAALQAVSRLFPQDLDGWRCRGPLYISHALAVTKDSTDPVAEELCYRMGLYFLEIGSYNSVEVQCRRCIAIREEGKKCDWDDEVYQRFRLLGLAFSRQGKANTAEGVFRDLLVRIEGSSGPTSHQRVQTLQDLAMTLLSQGKYNESEEMGRRGHEGCERVYGPDHPETLVAASNLASVLQYQGEYGESETMNRHVLQRAERVHGPGHNSTLQIVKNLAHVLRSRGKYKESEDMTRRELEGLERIYGPDHPLTLGSYESLASVLMYRGKYKDSETIHRRALEGLKRLNGPDHLNTITTTNNLAMLLCFQGKYQESEATNRSALEGYEKVRGPDHPDTLNSVASLAVVLHHQGRCKESEAMDRRALHGLEKILGRDHPSTLAIAINLARELRCQGKYADSEAISRGALEAYEKALGPNHPDTLAGVYDQALMLQCQGKYEESEMMHRRAVQGFQNVLGPDHPFTQISFAAWLQSYRLKESTMNRKP